MDLKDVAKEFIAKQQQRRVDQDARRQDAYNSLLKCIWGGTACLFFVAILEMAVFAVVALQRKDTAAFVGFSSAVGGLAVTLTGALYAEYRFLKPPSDVDFVEFDVNALLLAEITAIEYNVLVDGVNE